MESDHRPTAYKTVALPLSYTRIIFILLLTRDYIQRYNRIARQSQKILFRVGSLAIITPLLNLHAPATAVLFFHERRKLVFFDRFFFY